MDRVENVFSCVQQVYYDLKLQFLFRSSRVYSLLMDSNVRTCQFLAFDSVSQALDDDARVMIKLQIQL